MGLRDRIQERREGSDEPGASHYQMREKMFSIGDDYWIENGTGQRVFKVDGKALRVRDTLVLEDASGNELYAVQEKELRVRDTMEVERNGDTVAKIKKALVSPVQYVTSPLTGSRHSLPMMPLRCG